MPKRPEANPQRDNGGKRGPKPVKVKEEFNDPTPVRDEE